MRLTSTSATATLARMVLLVLTRKHLIFANVNPVLKAPFVRKIKMSVCLEFAEMEELA